MKRIGQPSGWDVRLFEIYRYAKDRAAVEILFRMNSHTLEAQVSEAGAENS